MQLLPGRLLLRGRLLPPEQAAASQQAAFSWSYCCWHDLHHVVAGCRWSPICCTPNAARQSCHRQCNQSQCDHHTLVTPRPSSLLLTAGHLQLGARGGSAAAQVLHAFRCAMQAIGSVATTQVWDVSHRDPAVC